MMGTPEHRLWSSVLLTQIKLACGIDLGNIRPAERSHTQEAAQWWLLHSLGMVEVATLAGIDWRRLRSWAQQRAAQNWTLPPGTNVKRMSGRDRKHAA
ncbi:hypothetical protein [Ruegeria sp. HKCCA6707]|uniref:hypothetical protein n=1 Tax=Ruegeria sp. HKCCA6707 TaxID=2682996 RepID=UPI001C2C171A|nr:hypothetical protein [Ruegeria sp. HKCCA6707]